MRNLYRNIALVVNPNAGKGKALMILPEVRHLLSEKSIQHTIFIQEWPENFEIFSDVYIIGGDGTLNYFINRYPFIEKPLSIFKGGTGNDFAGKLYGSLSVEQYFQLCMTGSPRWVDSGTCNQHLFMNGVGIGFDGAVVKYMKNSNGRRGGNLTYMYAVLRNILFYKEKRMGITGENLSLAGRFFMITIANGSRFGGKFVVAPCSLIDDGLLNIITIKNIKPFKRLIHLPKLKNGTHLKLPFVSQYLLAEVKIQAPCDLPAHCDGELIEADTFTISISKKRFSFRF